MNFITFFPKNLESRQNENIEIEDEEDVVRQVNLSSIRKKEALPMIKKENINYL
jgi:hypothetical protein